MQLCNLIINLPFNNAKLGDQGNKFANKTIIIISFL